MPSSPYSFQLPSDYGGIKRVHSFRELVETPFGAGVNALCWQRELLGDFKEVIAKVSASDDIVSVDEKRLKALSLSPEASAAREVILADLEGLRVLGLSPVLDCIRQYPRDVPDATVPTDVYSFHVDSAGAETDTYLCTYAGAPSEGVRNEDARNYSDIPEIRAKLLEEYGGRDDENFGEFLSENCYDLHFAPDLAARPFSFGIGNFWRIAVKYPGSPVLPCVHRAPETFPGSPPRLLLIS